jgi:hypothetical protein
VKGPGVGYRTGYSDTAKDRERRGEQLQRDRNRVAAGLAALVEDVRAGRRRMTELLVDEVQAQARRLADLDARLP